MCTYQLVVVIILFCSFFDAGGSVSALGSVDVDPALSWLAFARASAINSSNHSTHPSGKGPPFVGPGPRVLRVVTEFTVPSNPASNASINPNPPAFWYGIEPRPALNLIQPVLKWENEDGWSTFNEYFDWSNGYDFQSPQLPAEAGDPLQSSLVFISANNSYTMTLSNQRTGQQSVSNIPVVPGKVYSDVYFVVEHKVQECNQLPTSDSILFSSIEIEWERAKQSQEPWTTKWLPVVFVPDCSCQPIILNQQTVQFVWKS